jgi:hypothetical protein
MRGKTGLMMTARDDAIAKLKRLHKSSRYRTFFTDEAIAAFSSIETSALAGKTRACAEKPETVLRDEQAGESSKGHAKPE